MAFHTQWNYLYSDLQSAIFFSFKQLIFNSLTNCLGPRKLLHSGKLYKTKSNKELHGLLFNDFLLLTYPVRQFASSGSEKLFSSKSNAQFKMYKTVSASHQDGTILPCLSPPTCSCPTLGASSPPQGPCSVLCQFPREGARVP